MNNQKLFDIDIEDEEDEGQRDSSPSKLINKHFEEVNHSKYAAGTYTKGFFSQHNDDDYAVNSRGLPSANNSTVERHHEEHRKTGEQERKRKSRRQPIKLEPLKQKEETSVYQNFNISKTGREQFEESNLQLQPKIEDDQSMNEVKKRSSRRKNTKKMEEPYHQQPPKKEKIQSVQLPAVQNHIFFQQQEEVNIPQYPKQQRAQPPVQQQQIRLPQNRLQIPLGELFVDSDGEHTIEVHSNSSNGEGVIVTTGTQYFAFDNQTNLKKQLHDEIKKKITLRLEMVRDKDGFNTFWPEFHLHFSGNTHYLMSAKKTSSKPSSTFIISNNRQHFEENSEFYLGKMKSNIMGDILNVFGPGLSPSNARDKGQVPRQLIATIVYVSNIFQMGRPRQFSVYAKKPNFHYYKDFQNVRMYDEQIGLHQLYEFSSNKPKISVYHNRKPMWIQNIGGYMLNFKGRVETASIKNFILEQTPTREEIIIFGKVTESKFNIDMSYPISPYLAFAIALSSFDSRIMCE